jgi:DNA-binding transcriptional LysR family regulator
VAVQSSSHAGIFAAVRAGVAVSAVATGTAPLDLGEGGAGLPALPRIPVYLVTAASLRPTARRLEAALMAQMQAWAQP